MSLLQKLDSESSMTEAPVDKGNTAFLILLLEGLGNLFPWNVFITASGYFANRFCGTNFAGSFENYFSITYTLSQTIGLMFAIAYQDKISLYKKVFYPLVLYTVIFAITTLLSLLKDISGSLLFWITLLSASLCGLSTASLSGGLFGLTAELPSSYTGALMTGQGYAGLIVAVSSLLTISAGPNLSSCNTSSDVDDDSLTCTRTIDYSAFSYFLISTLILVTCTISFLYLIKLPFVIYFLERDAKTSTIQVYIPDSDDSTALITDAVPSDNGRLETEISWHRITKIFNEIRSPALSVTFVFTVTISIFPSLFVIIESTRKCDSNTRFYNDLFVPFMFFMFNFFDWLGRIFAGSRKLIVNGTNVWKYSLSRIIFYPLFLLCNIEGSELGRIFRSDVLVMFFIMFFSISNGYLASACMMIGPTMTSEADSPLAGTIMAFCLTLGLLLGSCLSFIVVLIARGSV